MTSVNDERRIDKVEQRIDKEDREIGDTTDKIREEETPRVDRKRDTADDC